MDSSEFKAFSNEFNTSIQKLLLKLNSDIEMLEYLYDKIESFNIKNFRFQTSRDLKPLRDLFNEAFFNFLMRYNILIII